MSNRERMLPGSVECGGEKGAALVIALFVITVLTVLGTLVLNTTIVELKMASNQKISGQVFYAAEAGLERAVKLLIDDFENDPATGGAWGNNVFYGEGATITSTANSGSVTFDEALRSMDMYLNSPDVDIITFSGGQTAGNASYQIYLYTPDDKEAYVMSRATGQIGSVAAVEYHLVVQDLSPYNNAIFSGAGITGNFNGSVNIAGSIYSKGDVNPGGNVYFTNNYDDGYAMDPTLAGLVDPVTDLDAKIRVSGAKLTLDGSAQIGYSSSNGAVAGVYVDGDVDWGTQTSYYDDFSDQVPAIEMPTILDGLTGEFGDGILGTCGYIGDAAAVAMSIYADWATGGGCDPAATGVSTGGVTAGDISIDDTTSTGWLVGPDANNNGLYWDAGATPKTLTVQGNVVITGDFTVGANTGPGMLQDIEYIASGPDSGSGSDPEAGATLFVGGDMTINGTFAPQSTGYLRGGNDTNSLGVVVGDNLTFDGKNGDFYTGFYYAEDQINFNKQSHFGGTVIGGVVNWAQVPNVYQVPNLANYLPPGMPGGYTILSFTTREWRRVY